MGVHVFPDNNSANAKADSRITALENETIKRAYYTVVSTTSGAIQTASGITLVAGQFAASGNSILSKINIAGYPIYDSPTDVSGSPVTSTLNVSTGAWLASATYVQTSVAIFFVITGALKDVTAWEAANVIYIRAVIEDIQTIYTDDQGMFNWEIKLTSSGEVYGTKI